MKVTKYMTTLFVASALMVGLSGCGSDAPDVKTITQVMDRSLDKTFESGNNKGNPFTISDMEIKKMEEVSENRFDAIVDFKIEAIKDPGRMSMSMTYGKNIMKPLQRMRQGSSVELKGIHVSLAKVKDTYKIRKAQ